MPRIPLALVALTMVFVLASCGGKSAEQQSASNTPPTSSPPATPPAAAPDTAGKGSQVAKVSAYDDGPRAGAAPVNAALVEKGQQLFQLRLCATCHGFGRKVTCPDLKGVTQRRTALWMQHQILEPDVMTKTDPIAFDLLMTYALQMPRQTVLTVDDAHALIEYLKAMDRDAGVTGAAR